MDLGGKVGALLEEHPHVSDARLIGSRARGQAHDFSDWDFDVGTDDFAAVRPDLPVLVAPLLPVAQQWDPFADHACYMLLLPGVVKVDLLFLDQARDVAPAYEPSPDTLAAMDTHFWDWIIWIEQKRTRGGAQPARELLHHMYALMLEPMGVPTAPTTVAQAITEYTTARDQLERQFGTTVPRVLEHEVRPVVELRQPARR
jgi:hypothetical protein